MPIFMFTDRAEIETLSELLTAQESSSKIGSFDLGLLINRAVALIQIRKNANGPVLKYGAMRIHTREHTVDVGNVRVELSPIEYRILVYLMMYPKMIVSKKDLAQHLYDSAPVHLSNVVEVHVSNLRKKLRTAAKTHVLQTIRGHGYRLREIFRVPS